MTKDVHISFQAEKDEYEEKLQLLHTHVASLKEQLGADSPRESSNGEEGITPEQASWDKMQSISFPRPACMV